MSKVNNKDTFHTFFTPCSSFFIVNFEQVNAGWVWSQGNQKKEQREWQMLKRIYGLKNVANQGEWHFHLSGLLRIAYKALPHRLLVVDNKWKNKHISVDTAFSNYSKREDIWKAILELLTKRSHFFLHIDIVTPKSWEKVGANKSLRPSFEFPRFFALV